MANKRNPHARNKIIGAFGEDAVVDYLQNHGCVVIDRNWRIREGEIDVVARVADGTIAFIEVKTRTSVAFGHPLESIDANKAHRLQRLALAWLATHQYFGHEFRIDCAAVIIGTGGVLSIEYRKNVL